MRNYTTKEKLSDYCICNDYIKLVLKGFRNGFLFHF